MNKLWLLALLLTGALNGQLLTQYPPSSGTGGSGIPVFPGTGNPTGQACVTGYNTVTYTVSNTTTIYTCQGGVYAVNPSVSAIPGVQYATTVGTIAGAVSNCSSANPTACSVIAPPSYGTSETIPGFSIDPNNPTLNGNSTQLGNTVTYDQRYGGLQLANNNIGYHYNLLNSVNAWQYNFGNPIPVMNEQNALNIQMNFFGGGHNVQNSATGYYNKSTMSTGVFNIFSTTPGQHNNFQLNTVSTSLGDTIGLVNFVRCPGGYNDQAGEGCTTQNNRSYEWPVEYAGALTGTPTTTSVTVSPTQGNSPPAQGEGRYLIRTNTGTINSGVISAITTADGAPTTLTGSGTSWPVSTVVGTLGTQVSAIYVSNATCASPIVITTGLAQTVANGTTGVVINGVLGETAANGTWTVTTINSTSFSLNGSTCSGQTYTGGGYVTAPQVVTPTFTTGTISGITTSSPVVVADYNSYEIVFPTAVTGTTFSAVFRKTYTSTATIAVGGLAGYLADLKADEVTNGTFTTNDETVTNTLRYAWPILYSTSATSAQMWVSGGGAYRALVSRWTPPYTVVAATCASPVVLALGQFENIVSGASVLVAGVGGVTAANGTWTVTRVSGNSFSLNGSTCTGQTYTSGGTAVANGSNTYTMYQAAEVTSVMSGGNVSNTLTLAPGTVNAAMSSGDTVEELNYPANHFSLGNTILQHYYPCFASSSCGWQLTYNGPMQGNDTMLGLNNTAPAGMYSNAGGTYTSPYGIHVQGTTNYGLAFDRASDNATITINCQSRTSVCSNSNTWLLYANSTLGAEVIGHDEVLGQWLFGVNGTSKYMTFGYLSSQPFVGGTTDNGAWIGAPSLGIAGNYAYLRTSCGATPATGHICYYWNTDGTIHILNSSGVDSSYGGGSGIPYPSGTGIPQVSGGAAWGSTLSSQGTGSLVQRSTGSTTTGDYAKYDSTGNVIDGGGPVYQIASGTGINLSVSGTTVTISTTSSGGTVTNVSVGSVPSWLTASFTNPTSTPSLTVAAATGQTSHQVIGTCGTATTFTPCSLVGGDIPAVNLAASGNGGVTGNLPVGNLNGGSGASPTTYWRGDGTWGTPSGSGTGVGPINVDTTGPSVTISTTYCNGTYVRKYTTGAMTDTLSNLAANCYILIMNGTGASGVTAQTDTITVGGTITIPLTGNASSVTLAAGQTVLLTSTGSGNYVGSIIDADQYLINQFLSKTYGGNVFGATGFYGVFKVAGAALSGGGFYGYTVGSAISSTGTNITIAPTDPVHHVTGTGSIQTMTPMAGCASTSSGCFEVLLPDGAWSITAGTGTYGFKVGLTASVGTPIVCFFDNGTSLWYPLTGGNGGSSPTFAPPYQVSGGNYYLQPDFGFQATLPPAFTTGYSTLSGTMTPSAGGGNGDINLTSLYSAAFLQQTALVSSSIEAVFSFGNPTLFTESNTYFGPYVCDSTNNKIYALYANVQGNYPVGAFLVSYSVTSCSAANTPSSATTVGSSFYVAPLAHLKLAWSGGTLTAYQSLNGGAGTPKIIGTASVGTIAASGVMGYGVTADVMSFKVQ